ncbi:hypothetical protein I4641_22470 [Waterburya agarophytonicola K14]|uniref:Uncharacterized protein n=1 Tax=Waterburya agarophytonicola KI4 TaxID=2874699 RepID=A0A964FM42_9CYAN|nr:hypothetical protein [Waterburya agarophytonicola]MCC0179713.1 hypothetical protein [Waterburya agarophytonicola KI4]
MPSLVLWVLVRSNGERLSVILAGHPKLKNDLRRPALEEIGGRTQAFSIEGIRGIESKYIEWLLTQAKYLCKINCIFCSKIN